MDKNKESRETGETNKTRVTILENLKNENDLPVRANIIDTPGDVKHLEQIIGACHTSDIAILVVSAIDFEKQWAIGNLKKKFVCHLCILGDTKPNKKQN